MTKIIKQSTSHTGSPRLFSRRGAGGEVKHKTINNMNQEKINFRIARDFGETFNVSIKFLRQNFKLFFQSIFLIAGPFVLISAIAGAFYQSNAISMFSIAKMAQGNVFSRLKDQLGWPYVLFILAALVAGLIIVNTVYSFMINYNEKGPGGFTVNDVSRTVVKNLGNVISVFLVYTLFMILILVVIVGIVIGITSAVQALGILFIFLLIIGMIILLPPVMWQLSAIYMVRMSENRGIIESFSRTRDVMRGNFWWTWVIIVCSLIGISLASVIFALPQGIYQMVLMFTRIKGGSDDVSISFMIVATVCTFCTTMLYSVLYVVFGFHYFSLAEKKDGLGLMERINEIGTTPNNNVEQHY